MLAAMLRQNPKFTAGMTSPVSTLFKAMEDATAKRQETSIFVNDWQRNNLLRGLFETFYLTEMSQVVFDTSRMWCARLTILTHLFPETRFICCVRDLGWIMDSFERIYRRNNQIPSGIYGYDTSGTVYSRTLGIADGNGVVGYALNALKEACASEQRHKLIIVDYEDMCKEPEFTMNRIYEFIEEPKFKHDFDKVEYSAGEFDKQLAAPGLHDVKGRIEWQPRETILPEDLFKRFENDSFWKKYAER